MNCLSEETLMQLALRSPGDETDFAGSGTSHDRLDDAKSHLLTCSVCRAQMEHFRSLSASLQASHEMFELEHETYRARLLAALAEPEIDSERARRNRRQQVDKRSILVRRIMIVIATTSLAVLVFGFFCLPQSSTLFAQVVEQLRQTKSIHCKMSYLELKNKGESISGETECFWSLPNSIRFESREDGEVIEVTIQSAGGLGVKINHHEKSFRKLPASKKPELLIMLMDGLAKFADQPDRDLGKDIVEGQNVRVFDVTGSKFNPLLTGMTIRCWLNPVSKRPVKIELQVDDSAGIVRLNGFRWDEPADQWFSISIPAGYREYVRESDQVEEFTKNSVIAFKVYAKYSDGKYPQVEMIYGDKTRDDLFKNAGVPVVPKTRKDRLNPKYLECMTALMGLSQIHSIQHQNTDSAYYGLVVGPVDKDKILLRWKLDNDEYRVIYGDLHYENVSSTVLHQLEAK